MLTIWVKKMGEKNINLLRVTTLDDGGGAQETGL